MKYYGREALFLLTLHPLYELSGTYVLTYNQKLSVMPTKT